MHVQLQLLALPSMLPLLLHAVMRRAAQPSYGHQVLLFPWHWGKGFCLPKPETSPHACCVVAVQHCTVAYSLPIGDERMH